jgi:hypothetical protein
VAVLGQERKAQSWLRENMPSAFLRRSRSWRRVSTSRAETPDFLFWSRLMPTAGKALLSMRSFELTPRVKRPVGNQEIAGNLGHRFVAAFQQLNRFPFERFGNRSWGLLHGLFPSWSTSTSSSFPSPLSRVKTTSVKTILIHPGSHADGWSNGALVARTMWDLLMRSVQERHTWQGPPHLHRGSYSL